MSFFKTAMSFFKTAINSGLIVVVLLAVSSCEPEEKRIFYLNSYHEGYPSSDSIYQGILDILETEKVLLEVYYLDSKRNPEPEILEARMSEAVKKCRDFRPDLVIASDDHAVSGVVAPHLQDEFPVVFCGVNWSAGQYQLGPSVTGMLEVLPLRETIELVRKQYPDLKKISILSENSVSEKNNTLLLDTLYRNMGLSPTYMLVDDFEQWKNACLEAMENSDIIYMPTQGAIRDWKRNEAISFVREHSRIPSITCDDFMMAYCMFGLTKVAAEQGRWAAESALRILEGRDPSSIPYARNQLFEAHFNPDLAAVIDFKQPE